MSALPDRRGQRARDPEVGDLLRRRRQCLADQTLVEAVGSPHEHPTPVARQLEYRAAIGAQLSCRGLGGLTEQLIQPHAGERSPAEVGDRRLLTCLGPRLVPGVLGTASGHVRLLANRLRPAGPPAAATSAAAPPSCGAETRATR